MVSVNADLIMHSKVTANTIKILHLTKLDSIVSGYMVLMMYQNK